jgi:hypothetical protein
MKKVMKENFSRTLQSVTRFSSTWSAKGEAQTIVVLFLHSIHTIGVIHNVGFDPD